MPYVLAFMLLAVPAFVQPALHERMLVAEDRRAPTDADLAPLRQGIGSRDPATRRQAVRAIGRLERPDLIALVSRLLTDANSEVRIETVNAIGQMARGAEGVAAARSRLLARVKGEQTPRVRGVVAATLGRLAYSTAADVQEVDEDAATLTRIRRLARLALNSAGRVDRPVLESGLRDSDDEVRRITMLSARADIEARDYIIKAGLIDREPRVRYEALQTWARAFQTQSCGPIFAAVRDENPHVMLLALDLLGNGCPATDRAPAMIVGPIAQTLAASRTWHAPAHALVSLAKLDTAEARKLLPLYVSHATWQVRMYAARAAGAVKAAAELITLGRDANDNVREAALGELIAMNHAEAEAIALEALTRPDYQLLMTAARALTTPTNRDRAVAALTAAHHRLIADNRDTSRDPRTAIITRLEALGVDVTALKAAAKPLPIPPVRQSDIDALKGVQLRFVMAGKGAFDLRLLVDEAPATALRVATRAREGYYNGLTFHRVVPNFVIQGGSPGANEYAGDRAYMRDEVGLVSHRRGTVGISTRGRDTGDAQMFVNLVDLPRLDHTYTVFAEVVAGMDVVDRILEGDVIERVEIK
jgi:cyclophilin family peptidyl-prolyl cis-trans isomerase/HEAT repeat protein